MDLLTASVMVPREDGAGKELAVVLIPAGTPGLQVSEFWATFALAGAESEQVSVDGVLVPYELVVRTHVDPGQEIDDTQVTAFLWFELLITASYLGVASALVERVVGDERIPDAERVRLVAETEAAMSGLENLARQVPDANGDRQLLADALYVRYAVQDTIARVVPRSVELLGGMRFFVADDIAYLAACANGLGFHPPSRGKMSAPLARHLADEPLAVR